MELVMQTRSSVRFLLVALAVLAAPLAAAAQTEQTPAIAEGGSSLFRTYCASCHGTSARGDGPLAEAFKRRPPDLTAITVRHRGTFPKDLIFATIDGRRKLQGHGGPDMPVWGDAFRRSTDVADEAAVRRRIQALVDFLETIQIRNTQ
jgi:mono/diheme cytochrome c family protein